VAILKLKLRTLKSAYVAVLLFGIISLMGDIVYEGGRGLVPDYLKFLGASAVIVGLVGGLGEFLGYAVRLISGYLADATRSYWAFIFIGYGLIISIPLLGIASIWQMAIILMLFERLGKAFRTPSRDTILSIVSKNIGLGKAFGIHELMDQIGAIMGPLIVASLMFYSGNNYRSTFLVLLIPFLILLAILTSVYRKIGSRIIETKKKREEERRFAKSFYVYTLAVMLNTIGLIPAILILFKASTILQPLGKQWIVPIIYLLIQGVDASVALLSGFAYDKYGIRVLMFPFILSIFPPFFVMLDTEFTSIIFAAFFFGIVLGMQESIYRAAVSEFAPITVRGRAYGIFNTAYGVGFLISGIIYGLFIDYKVSIILVLLFVIITQASAIIALLRTHPILRKPKI
jgi:MFS family permease